MEVCKCGEKLTSHMVKAGKKFSCKGCGREDIDDRFAAKLSAQQEGINPDIVTHVDANFFDLLS